MDLKTKFDILYKTHGTDAWDTKILESYRYRNQLIHELLGKYVFKAESILDIGCGNGIFTNTLKKYGNRIHGVDVSSYIIDWSKRNYNDLNFSVGDSKGLQFGDKSFDLVCCFAVLYYMDKKDIIKTLDEVDRVLKDDGYACFSSITRISALGYKEVKSIIGDKFKIVEERSYYGRLLILIEAPLLLSYQKLRRFKDMVNSNSEFKRLSINKLRRLICSSKISLYIFNLLSNLYLSLASKILSSRALVLSTNYITKIIYGDSGIIDAMFLVKKKS